MQDCEIDATKLSTSVVKHHCVILLCINNCFTSYIFVICDTRTVVILYHKIRHYTLETSRQFRCVVIAHKQNKTTVLQPTVTFFMCVRDWTESHTRKKEY